MNVDYDELYSSLFFEEFMEENKSNLDEVIKAIKNSTDEVIIRDTSTNIIIDILGRIKNPEFKPNYNIKIDSSKIELYYCFPEFFEYIKKYIPKTIKKIALPLGDANIDVEFLKNYKNLEEIEITDGFSFSTDELDYLIKNTNIKKINARRTHYFRDKKDVTYSSIYSMYKDILIENVDAISNDRKEDIIVLCSDKVNKDQIIRLLKLYKNLDIINLEINRADYTIKIKENDVIIKTHDLNIDNITEVYDVFVSLGYNVKDLYFTIKSNYEEKTEYTKCDYTKLDQISKSTNVHVSYNGNLNDASSYDEFKGLVESIKWYKKIITDYDLSPLEKLTYAYDIMKTFKYNESENNSSDSRAPHRIIETGNIVCVGYTALLNEILNGIDPNISSFAFLCTCYEDNDVVVRGYHSRSAVRIDDDKYNVHGFYALDSTWDSYNENKKEEYGEGYDSLSTYRYFMVPFTEYEKYFPHDSLPKFFDGKLSSLNDNLNEKTINTELLKMSEQKNEADLPYEEDPNKIFNVLYLNKMLVKDKDLKEVLKSLESRRISFEEFLNLIENVRLKEGYSKDNLNEEISKIERINKRFFVDNVEKEKSL